jgi:site-specific DNA recombinase
LERPKLNELRELVRNGQVDVVVVYCLDRLSRDPTHGVIVTQELEKHSVKLEAKTEDVDNSELGKLINYIRGFASKLEVEKIRERTMRGKKAHLANRELPQGTGIGIYGYTWNKEIKKRQVQEFEAAVVRDVFHRVAIGESLVSVARILNQHSIPTKGKKSWHSLTIRRMIRNSAYIGRTYFKGVLLPNITPAIVDEDIFEAANGQLDKPKVRTGRPKNEYLLRNHAFCALCGKPLVGHCLRKKYRYYQCSNARPHETTKNCARHFISGPMTLRI